MGHFSSFNLIYTTFLQISLASFISLSTLGAQFSNNFTPGLAGAALTLIEKPNISQESFPVKVASIQEAIATQAKAEGVNPTLAQDIAFCESTNRQYAAGGQVLRGKKNPADVGLFQINEKYHLEKSRELGYDIYSSEGNIGYAMWLLKNEGNRHWNSSRRCWQA